MALKQQNTTPFDSDAQRFILAAGISNKTQRRAINYLVQGMKANNLWSKCAAIYPMVGGNVWSCKFNLKNPIDSNAAFRLSFVASPTITNNGVDWNGTTQYADTNLVPSTNSILSLNSTHLSYYSRENTATAGVLEIGGNDGTVSRTYFGIKQSFAINQVAGTDAFVNTDTSGFFIISRTTSTLTTEYRNGASVATASTVSSALSTVSSYLACRNSNGTAANFTDRQCAFASIGSGLTAADAFVFNQIVQQFQLILNRNV